MLMPELGIGLAGVTDRRRRSNGWKGREGEGKTYDR
jgi:hypothetical protein